jgi:hypothetical protein
MNNQTLLDSFKEKFDLKTDADLCRVFEMTRPQLADWRSGHRPIPILIKWRLIDHLELGGMHLLPLFVDPEQHALDMAADLKRVQELKAARSAKPKVPCLPLPRSDVDFIEESKTVLGCETDGDLEKLADLSRHTLSKARVGVQSLSGFAIAKIAHLRGDEWAKGALEIAFGDKGRTWLVNRP